ncbi:MAG: asparagine synthase-related protein [Nitrososphaerota archaeon]|nr:asparagine synthase C-terminal domain-containing protein [Candidatus Bathyarchaeota archaeon]MDW8193204.1 asparagine synthase-related protein [Nitrososphaerota archaeon]
MNEKIEEICAEIRMLVERAFEKNLTEGILLSGGLDTSILAAVAAKHKQLRLKAFTCAFQGAPAPDVEHALLMAKKLNLPHYLHFFTEDELYKAARSVIKVLRVFDPMEVRNSSTIYIGLNFAKNNGVQSVMTGDALDELMAGYPWLFKLNEKELELELQKIWDTMFFSSVYVGKAIGVEVKTPYLDPEFKEFAMKLSVKHKVREERGIKWGKWIMRKAFEDILPAEIAWRRKDPIEVGSGTTTLPNFFSTKISDSEFEEKKKKYLEIDKVTIRDKEQLFYYEIYREEIGVPHPKDPMGKICPQCNSNVPEKLNFCRTCGAFPV